MSAQWEAQSPSSMPCRRYRRGWCSICSEVYRPPVRKIRFRSIRSCANTASPQRVKNVHSSARLVSPNCRAVIFASDPDIAIIQSLADPFQTAQEAWDVYGDVRSDPARRSQRVVEFAVGEVKAATDVSNLHERMALSTRESRSERQTDRFLMMAILTEDLLTGGAGTSGKRV